MNILSYKPLSIGEGAASNGRTNVQQVLPKIWKAEFTLWSDEVEKCSLSWKLYLVMFHWKNFNLRYLLLSIANVIRRLICYYNTLLESL